MTQISALEHDPLQFCALVLIDADAPTTDAAPGGEPGAANGHANGSANGAAPSAGGKKSKKSLKQTDPPSITVKRLFPDGVFPEGEWQPYAQK
jgi:hypothetical protein